jgi:hypothetical protein
MTSTFDDIAIILASFEDYHEKLQLLIQQLCEIGATEIQKKFGDAWNYATRKQTESQKRSQYTYREYFSDVHGQLDHTAKHHMRCFSKHFLSLLDFVAWNCRLALSKKGKGTRNAGYWTIDDEVTSKVYIERARKRIQRAYPQIAEGTFVQNPLF